MTDADAYRDLTVSLTPPVVSRYLAANGWVLESESDAREIWYLPDARSPGRPAARIMVPLNSEYVDFTSRFADLLYALGLVYGWDAPELAEQLSRRLL